MKIRSLAVHPVVCFACLLSLTLSAPAHAMSARSSATDTTEAPELTVSEATSATNGEAQQFNSNKPAPNLTGLLVSGPTSVNVGQTAQYTAIATYSDGSSQTLSGPTVRFYTYESTAAIDDATGILTGIAAGAADVRFDYHQGGVWTASTPYPITVVDSASKTLTALIASGPTSVNVGQTATYTATATYSDGSSQTLSGPTVWFYTYESTATIDHATGILTGVSSGPANVRFDYNQSGAWTASSPYPISVGGGGGGSKSLAGVSITGPASVTVGQTGQYALQATYTDGSSQTVNASSWWILDATATVTPAGVVTGVSTGIATLHAYYTEGGVTRTADTVAISLVSGGPPPSGTAVYVSTAGSDSNSGSQTSPVRTIQRGVDLANQLNGANDVTVSIAAGVYRESVQIFTLNTSKALTLQGAGPSTILTGSDDWSTGWTAQGDGSYAHNWPYRWGTKPIPNGWSDYWNWDGNGYKRNRLLRWEQVIVNGSPLQAVLTRAEVAAAGTFYVDETGSTIYMRLPTGVNLAGASVEVATRKIPLAINGRNNVTLRSFAVMRNLGAIQESMVQIGNSNNLTFDQLVIRYGNYAGISTAYVNGLQIYDSIFSDNGVNGIDGYRDTTVLMQDSEVARNNWRGWAAEHKGFDTVHKWSEGRDITIRRGNYIDNFGHGLWFDGDNQRVLVDGAFSARNKMRGAYFELNGGPLTIQNSKLCENGFEGVANARSNNLTVTSNQIFNNSYWQVTGTGQPVPTNIVNWQTGVAYLATGANWTLTNNIIKGQPLAGGDPPTNECYPGPCGWAFWAPDADIFSYIRSSITSDYNRYYHSGTTRSFNIAPSYGGAVDFNAFRSVMQAVKPSNESHSSWGDPGPLSCTAQ